MNFDSETSNFSEKLSTKSGAVVWKKKKKTEMSLDCLEGSSVAHDASKSL